MYRPAEEGILLGDSDLFQLLLEAFTDLMCSRIGIRQRDDLFRSCGSLDDVDQLACEQHGLSSSRSCTDVDDIRLTEDRIPLLFVESSEIGCLDLLLIVHIFVLELFEDALLLS